MQVSLSRISCATLNYSKLVNILHKEHSAYLSLPLISHKIPGRGKRLRGLIHLQIISIQPQTFSPTDLAPRPIAGLLSRVITTQLKHTIMWGKNMLNPNSLLPLVWPASVYPFAIGSGFYPTLPPVKIVFYTILPPNMVAFVLHSTVRSVSTLLLLSGNDNSVYVTHLEIFCIITIFTIISYRL